MEAQERKNLKDKKRIVIKIGSSSLTHPETGELNLMKIEKLIRTLSDLRGQGFGIFRRHCRRKAGSGPSQAPGLPGGKTGLCRCGAGPADDGVSEALRGIQPDSRSGASYKGYHGK